MAALGSSRIAEAIGTGCRLVELGSGSSQKVRLLLDALQPSTYMPLDISKDYLLAMARDLAADYPWLTVHAACMDFTTGLELPCERPERHTVAFFPGSSIGNFEPAEAKVLLQRIGGLIRPDGGLLIGVDLKKADLISRHELSKLSNVTGGESYFIKDIAELDRIYAAIEEELRSQYLIAYQSSNTSGTGEFRNVELKVAKAGLEVRTLRGYYP